VASLLPSGSALLLFSEGTITTIAQSSDSAPPPPTLSRAPLRSPALNAHGDLAFVDGGRILLYVNGAVTELARLDDPVLSPGGINFGFDSVRLNDAGHVVFATSAQSSSTGFTHHAGRRRQRGLLE
jgi:hypothetical protein